MVESCSSVRCPTELANFFLELRQKYYVEVKREPNMQQCFCSGVVLVMTVEDEYRKHADKCRFLAECSPKMADRAFWLLLAQN
jgi:hypothetical protein